ncbi:MAG TPA: hypothetical protein VMD59_24420, partial [Acidimicrobiales bacterium]|nr:hypothetical protein [Acidimicrobiales bacterium]
QAATPDGGTFLTLDAAELGVAEHSPVVVVVARVASSAHDVEVGFADGATDSMAPVGGWVVLVDAPGPAYAAGQTLGIELSATGASGTLAQVSLPSDSAEALPAACVPLVALPPAVAPAESSPTSSSAVSSATTASGTTNPSVTDTSLPGAP